MDTKPDTTHFSRKKKFFFYCIFYFFLIIIFFISAEVVTRMEGIRPYTMPDYNTVVEPGGRLYINNTTLGYSHLPGTFKIIINHEKVYHRTHLPNTLRITHPLDTYNPNQHKPEIWMLGDSFTYGWLFAEDSETFPWMVQERLPKYEVVNYGVSGYGTIQSLIQLKQSLAKGSIPALVTLDYASFQDERNVCSRGWLRGTVSFNQLGMLYLPYAWLDKNHQVHYKLIPAVYHNIFPFVTHSALMNLLQIYYDKFSDRHNNGHAVTKALILEIAGICKSHKIPFVLVGMTTKPMTLDTLHYCHEKGIMTADISIDLNNPENVNSIDHHPNARGNTLYTNNLVSFLLKNKLVKD